jgi:hypothetical protein
MISFGFVIVLSDETFGRWQRLESVIKCDRVVEANTTQKQQ